MQKRTYGQRCATRNLRYAFVERSRVRGHRSSQSATSESGEGCFFIFGDNESVGVPGCDAVSGAPCAEDRREGTFFGEELLCFRPVVGD